jgi:hypothetical protein
MEFVYWMYNDGEKAGNLCNCNCSQQLQLQSPKAALGVGCDFRADTAHDHMVLGIKYREDMYCCYEDVYYC